MPALQEGSLGHCDSRARARWGGVVAVLLLRFRALYIGGRVPGPGRHLDVRPTLLDWSNSIPVGSGRRCVQGELRRQRLRSAPHRLPG